MTTSDHSPHVPYARSEVPDDVPSTPTLCRAAHLGALGRVRAMLAAEPGLARREIGPGASDEEKRAIHFAASAGHAEVVAALLDAGADPLVGYWPARGQTSALALATQAGHAAVVAVIERWRVARRGATLSADELIGALYQEHLEEAQALIAAQPALANGRSWLGDTPLNVSILKHQLGMARLLIDTGADITARDDNGHLPIHHALYRRFAPLPEPEIATMLLDRGVPRDIWVASALGDLAGVRAHLAADSRLANAHNGASMYPWGASLPLSMAAVAGHAEVVVALLDAGADPDAHEDRHAGTSGQEHGVPLHFAATRGHGAIVRLLLERGAQAATRIGGFSAAASSAYCAGHREIADLLVERGGHIDFINFSEAGEPERIAATLRSAPQRAPEGLWIAAVTGSDALAHLSLSLARSVGIPLGDRDLDNAIRAGLRPGAQHLRVVTRLVDAMRDLDYRGSDGSTLLHQLTGSAGGELSERERCAFVMVLIERGARLDIRDARTDATPLACAARHGHRQVVELLLARGALPNDAPRRTPLEWALASQQLDIADLLRSHGASEPTA